MMRSLYSGISGLKNHQTRMDVIGNNISNVNTAGYKTARVIFQDIFSQNAKAGMANQGNIGGTNPIQIGLGIRMSNVDVIHTRAAFGRTDKETDMMINGDGFFVVMQTNPDTGENEYLYTRAGNFDIDSEGYLVTSHGYFVMGYTVPLEMGVVNAGQPFIQNVPAVSQYMLRAGDYTVRDANSVVPPESDNFIEINVPGVGNVRIIAGVDYSAAGSLFAGSEAGLGVILPAGTAPGTYTLPADLELRVAVPGIKGQEYKPPVFGLVPRGNPEATGAGDLTRIRVFSDVYQAVTYDELTVADKAQIDNVLIPALRIAQEALLQNPGDPTLQQAVLDAQDDIRDFLADPIRLPFFPYETIGLNGFAVADNGDVSVMIANKGVVIGRLALAMFSNPAGLEKAGNSLYRETASSGPVLVTEALADGAGKIDAGGLEMSNVDLADQFTDMIVTQRGFQSNSRIISVSDTMLEELVNLKR